MYLQVQVGFENFVHKRIPEKLDNPQEEVYHRYDRVEKSGFRGKSRERILEKLRMENKSVTIAVAGHRRYGGFSFFSVVGKVRICL